MPLTKDLNISPYFDDFDANNQYHRILFRPGTAVQARELTQIQSMLSDQIEKFSSWAFRNGDIVTGCQLSNLDVVPFVRLQDRQTNGSVFSITNILSSNTIIVGNTTGLKASIFTANGGLTANYPNTNMLYVSYKGTANDGNTVFQPNEVLKFYRVTTAGIDASPYYQINSYSNSTSNTFTTGVAHLIKVSPGIVYIDGTFVTIPDSIYGIVNAHGQWAANNWVGFASEETIVTENEDPSLRDNALGYPNENAPGAHRLKIKPVLKAYSEDEALTANINPIVTFNMGQSVKKTPGNAANVYSIIGDALADRINETSGNFVTNQFGIDTISTFNQDSIVNVDSQSVLIRVSPGYGYAGGYPVGFDRSQYLTSRRGIDTKVFNEQQITFNYGGYFVINEVAGSFDFTSAGTVNLYSAPQKAVTTRAFGGISPTGTMIGTAQIRQFSYEGGGAQGSNSAVYLLHVFNIQMSAGYNTNQIKSVYYNGTNKGVGDIVTGTALQDTSTKKMLFNFGRRGLKNLRDATNQNRTEYVYRTKKTNATMYTNGAIVVTLPTSATGGEDILPYYVAPPSVLPDVDAATFTVTVAQQGTSNWFSGQTVSVSTTSNTVTGTSTSFTTTFNISDQIKVGSDIRTIVSISNNTVMTVDAPLSVANASANVAKYYATGKIIPISQFTLFGPTSNIQTTNTTSFTISTGQIANSTLNVDVTYDVLRTQVSPATKNIRKNRFVKINTTSKPRGPWCLGFPDIHKINAVYGSADGTYTLNGVDLSDYFVFDSGQKDTHYDLGYLYATGGYDQISYPYLLVELDYFAANTASGTGFFTLESYPVHDNTYVTNTSAIATKDIPLYVDEAGKQNWLRDYIDFRIPSSATATDTGNLTVDANGMPNNSSQITTAISLASVNPANTLTLVTTNLNNPAYGYNFQADYTIYLPRKDLIFVTTAAKSTTSLKVPARIGSKEGLSSLTPQQPLYPDNGMVIGIINVPPYPSLAGDEIDNQKSINKSSKNLVRDTSTAILTSLVQNRRYTMKDIGTLDQRITTLETYASLSLLETKTKDIAITDSNGLDRYKNGFFVDPFNDFSRSEISNPEYTIAIDSKSSVARPKFNTETINLEFNPSQSTNIQKTGRVLSLPYDEVPFIKQPRATQYRSVAALQQSWMGKMILCPGYDNHVDTHNTASASIVLDNTGAWQQFANSPFGQIWGEWTTTVNTSVSTTKTGTVDTYLDGTLVDSTQI